MKDLEDLTLKILKTSHKFTSNDYIKTYNIIYLHCTEQTDNYEIKGRVIYDKLESILVSYFKSMRPVSSLNSFYLMCLKLEKSFELLEKVYFYLERFFINVNINKKGENVVHLVTLYNKLLYKHYIYSCMPSIEEYFIYEIECIRNGNLEEMDKIKITADFLKGIFLNIENELEYEHFLEMCINSFNDGLKNENIETLIQKINIELKLSKELFDFRQKKFYSEITKSIAKNFKKFLGWYFCKENGKDLSVKKCKVQSSSDQTQCLSHFNTIKLILFNMDDKYIDLFFSKLSSYLLEYISSLENIRDLFSFFMEFKETFNDGNVKSDELEVCVEKEIISKLKNYENIQDHFSLIISDFIDRYECKDSIVDRTPDYLFYLTNLLCQKNQIIKKFSKDCLQRILNNFDSVSLELKLIHLCETHCGSSSVSWLKLIVQTYNTPLIQSFGLSDQDDDFITEMRLITKGFCNLEITATVLHPKLLDLQNILIKRYMLKYPRSEIRCCYPASPIIFEINGVNICMSTDKVSLLLYLRDESNLGILKLRSKDPNFDTNIEFLENHKIIIVAGSSAYINEMYNGKTGEVINLFEYEIKSKSKIENKVENANLLETAVESSIMKFMKRVKKSTIVDISEELKNLFNLKDFKLENIINKLEDKGYLKFENQYLVYIP
jgi:hypothetical protein